jgi:hypothetical protein
MDGFVIFGSPLDFLDFQLDGHFSVFSSFSQQLVDACHVIPQLWHIPLKFPFSPHDLDELQSKTIALYTN